MPTTGHSPRDHRRLHRGYPHARAHPDERAVSRRATRSWPGTPSMAGRWPSGGPATRTRSSSRRRWPSRPRRPAPRRTGSGSWSASRRSRRWPPRPRRTCFARGRGWATTAAPSPCGERRGSSSRSTAVASPRRVAELEALPGVGPYTARAVAALAFGVPVGRGRRQRPARPRSHRRRRRGRRSPVPEIQAVADASVPADRPGAWTHAADGHRRDALPTAGAALRLVPGTAVVPVRVREPSPARRRRSQARRAAPARSHGRRRPVHVHEPLACAAGSSIGCARAPNGEWVALDAADRQPRRDARPGRRHRDGRRRRPRARHHRCARRPRSEPGCRSPDPPGPVGYAWPAMSRPPCRPAIAARRDPIP